MVFCHLLFWTCIALLHCYSLDQSSTNRKTYFFFYYYNRYVNDGLLTSVILFVMVWYFFQKWNCWVQGYNAFLILINHPIVLPKDCTSLYSQKYFMSSYFPTASPTWSFNFC